VKNVLFYLPFTKVGGLERVSIEYLNGLIQKGYSVDLIIDFDMGKDGNTLEHLIPKEISYTYIKPEKLSKFIYGFRTRGKEKKIYNLFLYSMIVLTDCYYYHTKVKHLLKNGKYDYTISFYQFLPSYITSDKSAKHIIWLHGSVEHFFGKLRKIFKNNYKAKLKKYDYIVTIAEEMREQLIDFCPSLDRQRVKMVYNPFDFETMKTKSTQKQELNDDEKSLLNDDYFCTVTRIDEHQKDLTTLILAYEKLYRLDKIKEKLYIIGDGPSKSSLEDMVKGKHLENEILFLGRKLNPFVWMKNAKAFVLSSVYEGLPTVLIEAMACEVFVISSKCKTGPTEILKNGQCGDLFEVGNVNELSEKLIYALKDKDYRESKIKKASKSLVRFEKEFSMQNLYDILEN